MRSNSNRKALMRAMHSANFYQFRSILDQEGWPSDSEWSDYELLVSAIKHNHRRIALLLLDKGARVTKGRVSKLVSPLHAAAVNKTPGWSKVIARLLSRGANVTCKNNNTDTAVHAAFKAQAPDEIIDILLMAHVSKSSADVFNRNAMGSIHIACTRPNVEVVREFVEADRTIVNRQICSKTNVTCIYNGYTPLHFAVEHGRLEIAEYLLTEGADIYRKNVDGSTPLHLALELRNIEMIDVLLRYDTSKVDTTNSFGLSHFMAACAGSNSDLLDAYMQKTSSIGALINSQVQNVRNYANSSYTPLLFAAEVGRQRTVELLLSRGADCCALARNNVTPHVLAHQAGHEKIACLLDKQCRFYRWSTESSKALGNRHDPIIDNDEQGNIVISFERKVDSNDGDFSSEFESSSSDQESVKSDDTINDIAWLSHDDLVAFFAKVESSEVQSEDSQATEHVITEEAYESATFDLSQLSRQDQHFYTGVESLIDNNAEIPSSFTAETNLEQMPNNSFTRSDSHSFYQSEVLQSQFSTLNDFSSFNPVAASTFMSNISEIAPQNAYYDTMPRINSIPDFVDQIHCIQTSTNATDFIQVPEIYSIPWPSFSSPNHFDFNAESHATDSGVARSNSFVSSYFTDSDINVNGSQGDFQTNFLNSHVSQNFKGIDYSGFFSAPSSTPINDMPYAVEPNQFGEVVDANNNQFVAANDNVYYQRY